jgi:transcriptional regulator with XRE-family HTH domain
MLVIHITYCVQGGDAMERNANLGENIRLARKRKGLTQEQLAELCEKKPSYITSVETSGRNPKISTIKQIADALEVDYRTLLEVPKGFDEISEDLTLHQMALNDISIILKKYFKDQNDSRKEKN